MELTLDKIQSDYRENLFNFIIDKVKQESDKTIYFEKHIIPTIIVFVLDLGSNYKMKVEEIFLDSTGELQISGIFSDIRNRTTNNISNLTSLPYNIAKEDEDDKWIPDFYIDSIDNEHLLIIAESVEYYYENR